MLDFNPFSLSGKTILVTGASSGIGKNISLACSKMGARLVITGRCISRLKDTINSLSGSGHLLKVADITQQKDVDLLVSDLPILDGVVHCAGVSIRSLCKQLDGSQVASLMNTNFISPVMLQTNLLMHKKISKGASIIFLSSIATEVPSVGNAIYSASKGAIVSYSKCLSLELAPRQIRVNCISPGMVWTDLILNGDIDIEQLKEDEKKYPLKRYGQPEDIANLAIYMLSDASSWMTGSNVKIAGGL